MLELLIVSERKRRILSRKLLKICHQDGNRYFGVAVLLVGISIIQPGLAIAIPVIPVAGLVLIVVGLILCLSIILAPFGLMLL